MLYSDFLLIIRRELRDFDMLANDKFSGDATTLLFPLTHRNVKASSYTVYVGGVLKTETTDYALDKDTGYVTFVSAPTSGTDNVQVVYRYNKLSDQEYLDAINDGIDRWRWKFFKEVIDTTTIKTVKNQYEYDLSILTGILKPIFVWYSANSTPLNWSAVSSFTNWQYLQNEGKLQVNPTFDVSGLALKIRYLKLPTKGTATSSTLDLNQEWLPAFKKYVKAQFYDRIVPERIMETGAVTTIPTYTPAQLAYQMAQAYLQEADKLATMVAPRMPNSPIKNIVDGILM